MFYFHNRIRGNFFVIFCFSLFFYSIDSQNLLTSKHFLFFCLIYFTLNMNFEVRLLSSPYMPQNSLAGVSKIWISLGISKISSKVKLPPNKNIISETFKFHAGNSIFVPKHYCNTGFLNPLTPSVVNFGSKNPRGFIYVQNILNIHFPAGAKCQNFFS
jgi:hypothetical protein